jgi:hypothetical protein
MAFGREYPNPTETQYINPDSLLEKMHNPALSSEQVAKWESRLQGDRAILESPELQ